LDHDDWFLDDNKTLAESGVGKKNLFTYIYMLTVFIIVVINIFYYIFLKIVLENETEISLFNRADYDKFKANPEVKW